MTDLVQRLRDGLEAGAVDMADIMDAADEIERLRMTQEEREAVEGAIASEHQRGAWQWADTLRALLTRLS